jgi:hypothetical protein
VEMGTDMSSRNASKVTFAQGALDLFDSVLHKCFNHDDTVADNHHFRLPPRQRLQRNHPQ